MLKKRRYIFAAVLILLLTLLAVLLLNIRRGADAEPGASGVSFVCTEGENDGKSALQ